MIDPYWEKRNSPIFPILITVRPETAYPHHLPDTALDSGARIAPKGKQAKHRPDERQGKNRRSDAFDVED